jgi:hypothetical protein
MPCRAQTYSRRVVRVQPRSAGFVRNGLCNTMACMQKADRLGDVQSSLNAKASPGVKMTCLYVSLFCIPAMNNISILSKELIARCNLRAEAGAGLTAARIRILFGYWESEWIPTGIFWGHNHRSICPQPRGWGIGISLVQGFSSLASRRHFHPFK